MKRRQLEAHLKEHGCYLDREGAAHSWWAAAADFIVSRGASGSERKVAEPSDIVDDWGNLNVQTDAAAGDLMARLDEEEIAEFGETISQAWGYENPR